MANIIQQPCANQIPSLLRYFEKLLVTLIILNKNQDNLFHSDQHVLLWLQNSHALVDCACLMVAIL